jgi:hypothetical protein
MTTKSDYWIERELRYVNYVEERRLQDRDERLHDELVELIDATDGHPYLERVA